MANIQKETAEKIAFAYRDLAVADDLLKKISEALAQREEPDFRDAFGRRQGGLQLGVPHGSRGAQSLFDVPWKLAQPILEAYIFGKRAEISALSRKAEAEMDFDRPPVSPVSPVPPPNMEIDF